MIGRHREGRRVNGRQSVPATKKRPVYSYRSSRKESQRQFNRGDEKEVKPGFYSRFMLKSTRVAVAIIVIVGVFYFQSLSSNARVKVVGEESLRSTDVYEGTIRSHLGSSKLYLSKFTFNSQKIENDIKSQFPEIENIKIRLPIFQHNPIFEVSLASPVAQLVTSEKTYFIDGSGRALFTLADIPDSFDTQGLITVNDASGHEITLGRPALTPGQIGYIKELQGQMTSKNVNIDSMTLSNGGSGLNVTFTDTKYIVKFSFTADPRQSSGAYLSIRDQITQGSIKASEYVDVRIPERAYIK